MTQETLREKWHKAYVPIHNFRNDPFDDEKKIADWWLSKISTLKQEIVEIAKEELSHWVKGTDGYDSLSIFINKIEHEVYQHAQFPKGREIVEKILP